MAIKPSVSAGRREHCFAIELQKNTYVLQAGDFQVKNLWVAKLCEALRRGMKIILDKELFALLFFILQNMFIMWQFLIKLSYHQVMAC